MADLISPKIETTAQPAAENPLSLQLSSINAELLSNKSRTPAGWLADNVLKPAVNTAFIEPHNAVTSPINDAGKQLGATNSLLTDWNTYELPQAKLFSPEWFAQNVSSGLAMVVPYGIASLGARGALRSLGGRLELKGAMADVFKSKTTGTILGATVYDGLRKPRENETRLGNALGGAAGFSIFEAGNHMSKDIKGGRLLLARALTGMVGASSQHTLSTLAATGKLPDKEHLLAAAASGATMNIVLPKVNEKLTDFANAANVALGRGVPIETYLKDLALKEGKESLNSRTLTNLVEQNPFARVQETPGGGDSRSGNLVKLEPGKSLPERLGHELNHVKTPAELELRFQDAAKLLAAGDTNAARTAFTEARLLQELAARQTESTISQELTRPVTEPGRPPASNPRLSSPDLKSILSEPASNGKTYAENFEADFTRFAESKGSFRPTQDFRPFQDNSPQAWQKRQLALSSTDPEARLSILSNLRDAPQSQVRSIWAQLLKDPDARVRLASVDAIAELPPTLRLKSWFDAIASGDPQVRASTINKIGLLPAADRLSAWKHAFNQASVLSGLRSAELPGNKSAAELLVQAIDALPSKQKEQAWTEALNDSRTQLAARDNIAVLPESARIGAWQLLARQNLAGANSLAKQIPRLDAGDRLSAWRSLLNMSTKLDGEAAAQALKSLPENTAGANASTRFAEWRKLLAASAEQGGNKGVFDCISALPENMRQSAWQEAYAQVGKAQAEPATRAIEPLPQESRLAALQRIINEAPNAELPAQLKHLPADAVSALQKSIAEMPVSELQGQMAKSLPLWKLSSLPLENRVVEMQKIFSCAEAHPEVFSPATLRHWWWHLLPESGAKDPTVIQHSQPLKERLANVLPARQLAQMIFPEHPELAANLAVHAPEAVRSIAARFQQTSSSTATALEAVSQSWLKNRDLPDAVKQVMALPEEASAGWDNPLPELIAGLAKASDKAQQQAAIELLANKVMSLPNSSETTLAISLAASLRSADKTHFDSRFLRVIESEINSAGENFMWKLGAARELARLSREGKLGDASFKLPELRMPAVDLPASEQLAIRTKVESAFANPEELPRILAEGALDRVLPGKLSNAEAVALIKEIEQNPEFAKLPSADQQNLLWAALLEGAGKRPGKAADPGYEWASTKIAYGVLSSLGYPVERVQRIATLISRHSEAADAGRGTVISPEQLRDLAAYYRHPEAIRQIDILNQAKQKTAVQSLNAESELRYAEIRAALEQARKTLGVPDIPLLFSELKPGFGLRTMGGDWRLLVHTSGELEAGAFFKQLPVIESPNYSVSGSLVTPKHSHLYSPEARLVAILSGPSENISLAARSAMTGTNVDWARHVQQTLAAAPEMIALANEINANLAKRSSGPRSLAELFKETSKFDNLDQIPAGSPLRRALEAVNSAMTKEVNGKPLGTHNEVKLNNPTLVGIGIYRRGQQVAFEGMDAAARLKLLGEQKAPTWLGDTPGNGTTTVPLAVWQEALKRKLPIVVLD